MKQFLAFGKKEIMEQIRTGRAFIVTVLFCLFGLMNPAIAKLTPWMMKLMSQELAQSGMHIGEVEVNAFSSWTQYFKNMPIAMIIFIVMFSGILTAEFQNGTLIQVITKGMNRWGILASKTMIMIIFWSLGCLLCYGITWIYNEYFWDNSIVKHEFFAAFCFYFLGLWLITVILLVSTFFRWSRIVTLCTGAAFLGAYLVSLFPQVKAFSPVYLMNTMDILMGTAKPQDYAAAIGITAACIIINILCSIVVFNRRYI